MNVSAGESGVLLDRPKYLPKECYWSTDLDHSEARTVQYSRGKIGTRETIGEVQNGFAADGRLGSASPLHLGMSFVRSALVEETFQSFFCA